MPTTNTSTEKSPLLRFSIRTVLFGLTCVALVCSLFTSLSVSQLGGHTLLVLAFGLPGASYGWDVGKNQRAATIGAVSAAVIGCTLLSVIVLFVDFARIW